MNIRATVHPLTDLVDTLVAAIDIDRRAEVERLREALDDLGVADLFEAEVRLNGSSSQRHRCICPEVL